MKTRIYVDGYNFYYGCLKGTPYKWLNPLTLFSQHIIPSSAQPLHQPSSLDIRYFTARISGKVARNDHSVNDQNTYLRALEALYPEDVLSIIEGYFSVSDTEAFKIDVNNPQLAPRFCEKVKIWKLEEKQSDVNIAVEALFDALTETDIEQLIFVTNDTDIAPVMRKIRKHTNKTLGLIVPTKPNTRPPSSKLIDYADWTRHSIKNYELKASQMPRVIAKSSRATLRKSIIKPTSWYGHPELLSKIFDTLQPCMKGKVNKVWQWLETEKPNVEGLPILDKLPIEMLDTVEDANAVLAHAIAYAYYHQR